MCTGTECGATGIMRSFYSINRSHLADKWNKRANQWSHGVLLQIIRHWCKDKIVFLIANLDENVMNHIKCALFYICTLMLKIFWSDSKTHLFTMECCNNDISGRRFYCKNQSKKQCVEIGQRHFPVSPLYIFSTWQVKLGALFTSVVWRQANTTTLAMPRD